MIRSARRLALLVALASASTAAWAQSAMNYGYRVDGAPQAAPVQAFDDGRLLYVQLRNPMQPPAPIGPNGLLTYTIRGPYLVLPIVPRLTLRYGPYTATVQATGAGDYSPGVVSVTRPVEVRDTPAPAVRSTSPAPAVAPVAAPLQAGVTGEIVAEGKDGTRRFVAGNAGSASGGTLTYAEAAKTGVYAGMRVVVLRADGTSAGAQAAQAAQAACRHSGATCRIEYAGAPSGRIQVETSR